MAVLNRGRHRVDPGPPARRHRYARSAGAPAPRGPPRSAGTEC